MGFFWFTRNPITFGRPLPFSPLPPFHAQLSRLCIRGHLPANNDSLFLFLFPAFQASGQTFGVQTRAFGNVCVEDFLSPLFFPFSLSEGPEVTVPPPQNFWSLLRKTGKTPGPSSSLFFSFSLFSFSLSTMLRFVFRMELVS